MHNIISLLFRNERRKKDDTDSGRKQLIDTECHRQKSTTNQKPNVTAYLRWTTSDLSGKRRSIRLVDLTQNKVVTSIYPKYKQLTP